MAEVTLKIPEQIKKNYGIGKTITYTTLITKIFGEDNASPDLQFISYDKLSDNNKKIFNEADKLDRSKFTNI